MNAKIPLSVLVVLYTPDGDFLLIERVDGLGWQSVTGSLDSLGESFHHAALREVKEETGIDGQNTDHQLFDLKISHQFEIHPGYLHRYAQGTTHNEEHVFALQVPHPVPVVLNPNEHCGWRWTDAETAQAMVFSHTNSNAIKTVHDLRLKTDPI